MADSEGEEEAASNNNGKVSQSQMAVDDDLREMAKAAAWSVSSCKPGNCVLFLRDDNLDTFWQSDGVQPHLVNIQFQKKVKLQLLVLYVDFKLDESYTPSKISIRAGHGFHNLKEIKTVELVEPVGWVHISLSGTDPRSDGVQPHLVNIQFQKKVKLQLLVLYVDFKLDESYTPSKISIRAGHGFHNLKEIKTVELVKPVGWVHISLSGTDPRETFIHTFMLQIAVLSNHLNGRDTHVRQIKIYGPRPNPVPHQPFHFTSHEFITYSTLR